MRDPAWSIPAAAAAPKPLSVSSVTTASSPRDSRSISALESFEALSTPTIAFIGRVCRPSVVSTAGSHTSPSWATTTAVTKCERRGITGSAANSSSSDPQPWNSGTSTSAPPWKSSGSG